MSTILLHMVWIWCKFRMQVWNVLHAAGVDFLLTDSSTLSFCSSRKFTNNEIDWLNNISNDFFSYFHRARAEMAGHFINRGTFSTDFNHFVITRVQKWRYLYFRFEICYHRRSQWRQFRVKRLQFWRFGDLGTFSGNFDSIFTTCGQNWYMWASVQISDTVIYLAEPDFPEKWEIFGLRYIFLCFWRLSRCAYAEMAVFLLPVRNLILPSFSIFLSGVYFNSALSKVDHFVTY